MPCVPWFGLPWVELRVAGGTLETRLQIIDLIEKVVATLPDDLSGELFRHTTMTPAQTKQLIDDHFLFRGKDCMQAASGYHQYWPEGRGIFQSKDKKFLLWINEGDHLRIISMEQGGDVRAVFDRLSRGIAAIEAGLKAITGRDEVFMRDDRLGMITCCPSNLGTAMRGSVHIMVPKLIAKMGLHGIDDICRERNCQARGSTGEHSAVVDRIDISNWRRLGFRECDLVQDMIRTANYLAGLEAELEAAEKAQPPAAEPAAQKALDPDFDLIMDEHLARNEWPAEKMAGIKSAQRVSLMAQAMSEDLFNKLKDIKSPKVCSMGQEGKVEEYFGAGAHGPRIDEGAEGQERERRAGGGAAVLGMLLYL